MAVEECPRWNFKTLRKPSNSKNKKVKRIAGHPLFSWGGGSTPPPRVNPTEYIIKTNIVLTNNFNQICFYQLKMILTNTSFFRPNFYHQIFNSVGFDKLKLI